MSSSTIGGRIAAYRAKGLRGLSRLGRGLRLRKPAAPPAAPPGPATLMNMPTKDAPPSLSRPVSQGCTQAQFDTDTYRYWCAEIREPPRHHRKQWEFCYILQALAANGALAPERRGVGYGVGTEPLTAVFAARGCTVLATDLEPDAAAKAGWVDTNQHASQMAALNTRGICAPGQFAHNVSFRAVDMNHIPPDLTDFDFTWSACCLEHLGSITNGLAFIENSVATLRPGGIAVHTTELNCSSDDETIESGATVLFRKQDIRALCARLRKAGHHVVLNFNLGDLPLDGYIDVPPYTSDRHLKLQIAQYAST
ncbi:MAG TPA: class I SAM-dependent methyltransferase, partial [Acetobacteraceae bacterium]|nr:class I SAM-dependent methyltransferase [Acetobacteraceae bacterium]